MFGNAVENMVNDRIEKADFNKDGKADKAQLMPAVKKLGASVDDFGAAIDAKKAGAAFGKLGASLEAIELAVGADLLKDGVEPAEIIQALSDPKVQKEAVVALIALKELVGSVDRAKAGKAFGELLEAKAVVDDYLHPKKS